MERVKHASVGGNRLPREERDARGKGENPPRRESTRHATFSRGSDLAARLSRSLKSCLSQRKVAQKLNLHPVPWAPPYLSSLNIWVFLIALFADWKRCTAFARNQTRSNWLQNTNKRIQQVRNKTKDCLVLHLPSFLYHCEALYGKFNETRVGKKFLFIRQQY